METAIWLATSPLKSSGESGQKPAREAIVPYRFQPIKTMRHKTVQHHNSTRHSIEYRHFQNLINAAHQAAFSGFGCCPCTRIGPIRCASKKVRPTLRSKSIARAGSGKPIKSAKKRLSCGQTPTNPPSRIDAPPSTIPQSAKSSRLILKTISACGFQIRQRNFSRKIITANTTGQTAQRQSAVGKRNIPNKRGALNLRLSNRPRQKVKNPRHFDCRARAIKPMYRRSAPRNYRQSLAFCRSNQSAPMPAMTS